AQDFDGFFDLAVVAGEEVFGGVVDEDVGLDAVVFQAVAFGGEDADAGGANAGTVEQAERTGANDRAHGGDADDFAEAEGAKPFREHLGIAGGTLVLQDNHRAEEGLHWARDFDGIAAAPGLVLVALIEDFQKLLIDSAAAGEPFVD